MLFMTLMANASPSSKSSPSSGPRVWLAFSQTGLWLRTSVRWFFHLFHVVHCVVVYLKVGFYIQHPCVLDLCFVLELEVFEATAIGEYLNWAV